MTTCPSCGDAEKPKFDNTSNWCVDCVAMTLAEQERLRFAPERHEVIEVT